MRARRQHAAARRGQRRDVPGPQGGAASAKAKIEITLVTNAMLLFVIACFLFLLDQKTNSTGTIRKAGLHLQRRNKIILVYKCNAALRYSSFSFFA